MAWCRQATSHITWTNVDDKVLWCHMATLCHNGLSCPHYLQTSWWQMEETLTRKDQIITYLKNLLGVLHLAVQSRNPVLPHHHIRRQSSGFLPLPPSRLMRQRKDFPWPPEKKKTHKIEHWPLKKVTVISRILFSIISTQQVNSTAADALGPCVARL